MNKIISKTLILIVLVFFLVSCKSLFLPTNNDKNFETVETVQACSEQEENFETVEAIQTSPEQEEISTNEKMNDTTPPCGLLTCTGTVSPLTT